MEAVLIFRTVATDSIKLDVNQSKYNFFSNNNPYAYSEDVTEWSEFKILKWIFDCDYINKNYLFYELLKINNKYQHYFNVTEPILEDKNNESDIDLLLINNDLPNKPIAFQVKRVKGKVGENGITHLNKTEGIKKGILQAKKIQDKYEFYQSYLMLIVVIDGEKNTNNNFLFKGMNSQDVKKVYDVSIFENIPSNIGILIFEITKPSSKDVNISNVISSAVLKKPEKTEQSPKTTEKIIQFFKGI
jgi:hypothetical protein